MYINISSRAQISVCNSVHNTFRILLMFQKLLEKHWSVQPIFENPAECGYLCNANSLGEAFALCHTTTHAVKSNIVAHRTSWKPSTMVRELVRKNVSCKKLQLHYGSSAIFWITRIASRRLASQINISQQLTTSKKPFR